MSLAKKPAFFFGIEVVLVNIFYFWVKNWIFSGGELREMLEVRIKFEYGFTRIGGHLKIRCCFIFYIFAFFLDTRFDCFRFIELKSSV